ncbi:MAG: UDP-N-acetylmuramoyl-tripeptide--D-alanyl-D-alanine ligase, partial [Acidobacteriota bacterium]|nr:UDP-N-acetylmuramoyl-tripeptide--D-alanyl-D-alanine ligase [Acidobacteriota bacterium]
VPGPVRAAIDSRTIATGELFVGLAGSREDGGAHAAEALARGAWGVLVSPAHAATLARRGGAGSHGAILSHEDPLVGLQALARAWREQLGARVVAITGSTGKTSTRDILVALLRGRARLSASPQNFNTEIGVPLAILGAPAATEVLVLELAMRGAGQIAELTALCAPDVGVISNIGPVHLELLGSLENVAAAKAELIAGLDRAAGLVVPAGEPLLAGHLRADLRTLTFGSGGDVELLGFQPGGEAIVRSGERVLSLRPSFSAAHNLRNLLATVAVAELLGLEPAGEVDVRFSPLRGERIALPGGVTLINDCYNANPMSMRAALEDLALSASGRRVAVLGDMRELGGEGEALHRALAGDVAAAGVELLVTVGESAALIGEGLSCEVRSVARAQDAVAILREALRSGDTVLVKGSRAVALESVAESLQTVPESV